MNTHTIKRQVQKGFTLVELLIVVIILAILAAIVVPQFASSTDDARVSSLDSTLSNMRSAIDLYRQQHNNYPGETDATGGGGLGCSGTQAPGSANGRTLDTFYEQLTRYTNIDGVTCSTQDPGFDFGPYLKKRPLPENPISGNNTVTVVFAGDLDMAGNNPALGWRYDTVSGKFIADDSVNTDSAGNTYDTH